MKRDPKVLFQIIIFFILAIIGSIFSDYLMLKKQPGSSAKVSQSTEDEIVNTGRSTNKWKSKTQLTYYNPEKAYEGFTLYPVSGPDVIKLFNMSGQVVHEWKGIDADRARLLPNGNILVLHGSKNRVRDEPWATMRYSAIEYDWEGKEVWKYKSEYPIHHDIQRLSNGNTIMLLKVPVPEDYKQKSTDEVRRQFKLNGDTILEVDPAGREVWHWNTWEHLDINDCGVRSCPGKDLSVEQRKTMDPEDFEDWTHANTVYVIGDNPGYAQGDKRFRPGNIIVHARNFWTTFIIDRETGSIVWRYQGDYKGGLIGGHEPSMIPQGLPGAGNIIILDNGSEARDSASFILEINPVTQKVVWVYDVGREFFTRARGSVQRLPNGNTLISEDRSGRVFEVTNAGEKVWEVTGNLLVVRAQRYAPDYCPQFAKLKIS